MWTEQFVVGRNLFNSLSLILRICRVLGLFPVTIQNINGNHCLCWSWKIYVLGVFAVTPFAMCAAYMAIKNLILFPHVTLHFRNTLDSLSVVTTMVPLVVFGVLFPVSAPFRYKTMKTIFDNLNLIDLTLGFPALKTQHQTVLAVFVTVCSLTTIAVDTFTCKPSDIWLCFLKYLPCHITYTVIVFHGVHFCHLLHLIKYRVIAFNRYIVKFHKKRRMTRSEASRVCRICDAVYDASNAFNSSFGVGISMTIFYCYLQLIFIPYFLFAIITGNDAVYLNMSFTLWGILYFCKLLMVVNVCHSFGEKNAKTVNLVSKLMCFEMEPNVKITLKRLLFVMTTRKNHCHCYTLENINRSLILSIIQSIAGYWMVLLQSRQE